MKEKVAAWKKAKETAESELISLEEALKSNYNAYIDSLCTYLNKIGSSNAERTSLYNSLGDDRQAKNTFGYAAEPFIKNQAEKYLLDKSNPVEIKSITLVNSCNTEALFDRKAI